MAIARNRKPPPVDPAAIAAFGAAAETREAAPEPLAPARPERAGGRATNPATDGSASSLIRWKGHENLRDRIKGYATTERYSEQDVMIRALRLGMEQIEGR